MVRVRGAPWWLQESRRSGSVGASSQSWTTARVRGFVPMPMKRTSGIPGLKMVGPARRAGLLGLCVCSCVGGCSDSGSGYQERGTSAQGGTNSTTTPPPTTTVTSTTIAGTSATAPATASTTAGNDGATAEETSAGGSGSNGVTSGATTNVAAGGSAGDDGSGSDSGGSSSEDGSGGSSSGGSSSGGTSAGGTGGSENGSVGVPGIIAVGYGGLRIVSRDWGQKWEDETHWSEDGGDDHDLLRTIAYGNGVWVSGGWRLVTSEDGVAWTDHGDAKDVIDAVNCPVTDGMAFGKGKFLVACGSNLAESSDGLSWERVGPTPDVGGHPHLVFDETTGQFACSGDDGASFVSSDGEEWSEIEIESVRLCEGLAPEDDCPSFYHDGVYLSTQWGGWIRRSTTGEDFMTTYSDQFGNNLFTDYSFAVGRVAP